jgi:hypothetical protein
MELPKFDSKWVIGIYKILNGLVLGAVHEKAPAGGSELSLFL